MHTSRFIALALAVLVLTVGLGPPAAAQTDDGIIGELFDSDDESTLDAVVSFVDGLTNRATSAASNLVSGGESADESADNTREAFNANSDVLRNWTNERTAASTEWDVLELEFEADDETETIYVVATVNNSTSQYTTASAVTETDRDVDESCTLSGHAARNADTELETFVAEFAAPNEDVTQSYVSRVAGEYGGSVDCTFSLTNSTS